MKKRSLVQSFNCAIEGLIYALKTQRNMRIHFLIAIFILLLGIYLNFNGLEVLMLCAAATFVLLSEMANTAIELVIDLVHQEVNPLARMAKDVMAGAVLVSCINAVVVGYVLFSRRLTFSVKNGLARIRDFPWHLTFISLLLILALVVLVKAVFHKGRPLRGGMPSGHSAVAFSMWTIISLLTSNGVIMVLTFIMALLIARSRLMQEIHSIWEVVAGALLGMLATLLVFQLLG